MCMQEITAVLWGKSTSVGLIEELIERVQRSKLHDSINI